MKPSGHRPPGDVRRGVVRYGLERSVTAAPAMIGSLLLLMLASAALNRWAGLLVLTWAACAAALITRAGERIAVRAAYGFHRRSRVQAALQPAWATALRVTGTKAGDVDLYV
jgi:STE24 endopeptidase